MKSKYFAVPFLAFAACDTLPEPVSVPILPIPPAAQDTCGAAENAGLVGQDATALERVLLMGQVRIIRPGQAVTQDFRPTRINFNIDASNRIASISCG